MDGEKQTEDEQSQCQIAEFVAINRVVPETERQNRRLSSP